MTQKRQTLIAIILFAVLAVVGFVIGTSNSHTDATEYHPPGHW